LLSKWGEPDERSAPIEGVTIWTYYNDLKWIGASPVILFPLPLYIPLGIERINFGVRGKDIEYVKHETSIMSIFFFPISNASDIIVGRFDSATYPNDCIFQKNESTRAVSQ
jgi:hypothetical protein